MLREEGVDRASLRLLLDRRQHVAELFVELLQLRLFDLHQRGIALGDRVRGPARPSEDRELTEILRGAIEARELEPLSVVRGCFDAHRAFDQDEQRVSVLALRDNLVAGVIAAEERRAEQRLELLGRRLRKKGNTAQRRR